jgi:hypothetical protein
MLFFLILLEAHSTREISETGQLPIWDSPDSINYRIDYLVAG